MCSSKLNLSCKLFSCMLELMSIQHFTLRTFTLIDMKHKSTRALTTACALFLLLASCLGDKAIAQTQRQNTRSSTGTQSSLAQSSQASKDAGMKQGEEKTEDDQSSETKTKKAKAKKVKIGGIYWYVDYDAALKIAREENKPMWLHFGENPG